MFSMLDQLGGVEGSAPSYPPYNIERTGENAYRISVAVAGFTDADLSIEAKENRMETQGNPNLSR
jgi:molecular chaperone IbpA